MNKLEELKKRTKDLNDGIYCYYEDNDFYINPTNDCIEVYYNKKNYYFKSYEEMISYPLFGDNKSIADSIDFITW